MNPILIVIPILTVLMYELGLTLRLDNLRLLTSQPRAIIIGLLGQIILLPLIAFGTATLFHLDALFFVGIMLIACSPGGSSSNIFSLLAGGNVALSVLLTTLSSLISLVTIPIVMAFIIPYVNADANTELSLPIGTLLVQNILLMLLPIALGILTRRFLPNFANAANRTLSRIAFPALLLLAALFFVQHYATIVTHFGQLATCITTFMLLAILASVSIAHLSKLDKPSRRTIIIEVGMQNAASAIAIASSPYLLHNDVIAIPAIIYALIMNVVLLTYLQFTKRQRT